ncbi:MAG: prepilin-type N-terminal cleavage/methylation domain-containing protein [Parvularculaceae bacterium]|nr:prepilin-type N-terminal cleavage/methylation domain-containing protein [Parvularculaceae bacterium]
MVVRTGERGFSLIELVVTLAIMAFALSVAAPPIVRMLASAAFREDVDALERELENIRVLAFFGGAAVTFDPRTAASGPLETARELTSRGWTFAGDPIVATAEGVCTGGILTAAAPGGRNVTVVVTAPDCQIDGGLGP